MTKDISITKKEFELFVKEKKLMIIKGVRTHLKVGELIVVYAPMNSEFDYRKTAIVTDVKANYAMGSVQKYWNVTVKAYRI